MDLDQRFDLTREAQDDGGYDSTNEDDAYARSSKKARYDLATKERKDLRSHAKGDKKILRDEASLEDLRKQRTSVITLTGTNSSSIRISYTILGLLLRCKETPPMTREISTSSKNTTNFCGLRIINLRIVGRFS